ncbi:phage baseplate assembly protein V [Saccharospirillum alexandrii]|uniref:phage baseplate assembly protein V n=1 Tax=Saccharospirillum alexandrii TaxID=2448477 RepID=UPI000FD99A0C|nr:phage baseplate assembly protein V [Saccharospirillum alexandrii]
MERALVELAEQMRHRYYGKYRGTVEDNKDPENMGRLRARVPKVLGDVVSPWALPCTPYAGDGSGQYSIPPVGAGLWIEFEAGDPSQPIWSGCWWSPDQVPTNQDGDGKVPGMKVIRSEQGMMVSFDDDGQTLSVSDSDGSNILKIEVQNGQVLLKGVSKVVVEAPQIELVENASHPVVFGDQLMNYLTQLVTMLQTHTHPGQLAAGIFPVTPMIPTPTFPTPTSSLLSQKVKAG